MNDLPRDPDLSVATLANGVRVVAIRLPHLESASVSIFVRTGSVHEALRLNGISHLVEHMAFKGTSSRDCRAINLDAERLGAEVNAHTDKDHTAYHIRGLARDAGAFVRMLADIVRDGTFPEAELERERGVILQELIEDEDDPVATVFRLFDRACYGMHPIAQPVIGSRRNIERITRDELLGYVHGQYTGANVVVGVAGPIDAEAIVREAEAGFGTMPRGEPNLVEPPAYVGGARSRQLSGSSQSHLALGFPIPPLADDAHHASVVAAAVLGEGMSSPLMHEIREQRGLVYYAACSADVSELAGQFVLEASTTPEHLPELFAELSRLLAAHADAADPAGLERARNQIAVKRLHAEERPYRRLEDAALDLFAFGRVRPRAEMAERLAAVDAETVRTAFERMLATRASAALAGKVNAAARERLEAFAAAPADASRPPASMPAQPRTRRRAK